MKMYAISYASFNDNELFTRNIGIYPAKEDAKKALKEELDGEKAFFDTEGRIKEYEENLTTYENEAKWENFGADNYFAYKIEEVEIPIIE